MGNNTELAEFIDAALLRGVDFAVCMLPEERTPHIFLPGAKQIIPGNRIFEIGPWMTPYDQRIVIDGEIAHDNAARILDALSVKADADLLNTTAILPRQSTVKSEYIAGVEEVIASCRHRDGKTVISRVICGCSGASWGDIFCHMADMHPGTMRFIFHTKATGGWIGATPETLLNVDFKRDSFQTMAFAGTRPMNPEPIDWDEKNLRENDYVSSFIVEKAAAIGLSAAISEPRTVAYGGNIEHLCRDITGSLYGNDYRCLLDTINPTPALCGTPVEDALDDIQRHEKHQRGCYGGFIAVKTPTDFRAFVTLRCCAFHNEDYAIFAGGGITPDSVAEDEWEETEAKSLFFRDCLRKLL